MEKLKHQALAGIEHWQEVLTRALEDTSAEQEKHRLERELAELQQARSDVDGMSPEQLEQLRDRLEASPLAWVEHRAGGPERAE